MAAPGGLFDVGDNGTYTVRTAAGAVTSTPGVAAGRRAPRAASPVPTRVLASLPQDIGLFQVGAKSMRKRQSLLD